jgi:hypothetical protein
MEIVPQNMVLRLPISGEILSVERFTLLLLLNTRGVE